ncbi:MAG TPA: ORF6N domain-containing protein [Bryobacteraceae bacterium]|jgi:hypothetical protein
MQSAAKLALAVVESRILFIRGQKVLLDSDLAALYEVETKVLNQAVKRNVFRFPEDFMFRLNKEEAAFLALRSQSVTSKGGRAISRMSLQSMELRCFPQY